MPMLDILQGTPPWVFGVLLIICFYGFKARRPHTVSPRTLLITPAIFAVWSLCSLSYGEHSGLSLASWLGGAALGGLVAYVLFPVQRLALDDSGQRLVVPGTWKILGIYLLFFAVKYFIGYQSAVHPEHMADVDMILIACTAAGFTVGLFCGRAAHFYRRWQALRRLTDQRIAH